MWLSLAAILAAPQAKEAATLAAKGSDVGAQHVEGGQASGAEHDDVEHDVVLEGQLDNSIFTVEAGEEGEAGDRERCDQPRRSGNWHPSRQPTHQAHILHFAVHGVM